MRTPIMTRPGPAVTTPNGLPEPRSTGNCPNCGGTFESCGCGVRPTLPAGFADDMERDDDRRGFERDETGFHQPLRLLVADGGRRAALGQADTTPSDREPLPKRDPGKTLIRIRIRIHADAAPVCCGQPMRRDGVQSVCGSCGAWVQTGLLTAGDTLHRLVRDLVADGDRRALRAGRRARRTLEEMSPGDTVRPRLVLTGSAVA
ncbi:hypothetical protein ACWGDX_29650 [Streptomyces sp. NPDC055025]